MDTGTAGTGTDFRTGAGHVGKCDTLIPVPETSVIAVRHQFGKLGTTSIPVLDT